MSSHLVSAEDVEKTITAFTRLDQRGDKKAMNKLAQRLQKEQPFLLQHAAAVRTEHGDAVGEAAVFYATLVWAMFDRGGTARCRASPRRTSTTPTSRHRGARRRSRASPTRRRTSASRRRSSPTQPHIYAKLAELLAEDVKEAAMTAETASTIIKPTEVVIEAFDAALSGRRPGERQGTIVASEQGRPQRAVPVRQSARSTRSATAIDRAADSLS